MPCKDCWIREVGVRPGVRACDEDAELAELSEFIESERVKFAAAPLALAAASFVLSFSFLNILRLL